MLFVLIFAVGCTGVPGGDGLTGSSSSSKACVGDGGLVPSPGVPQSFPTYTKYSVPDELFVRSHKLQTYSLPAQTQLVAIVDEICLMQQPQGSPLLSQSLRAQVARQAGSIEERAYPFQLAHEYTRSELYSAAVTDPCLLMLSEESEVHVSATSVNDPQFSSQVHLTAINAPTAWDTFYSGLTGTVVIAVIDDGIELTHSDLSSVLWTNSGETASNGLDDDGNGYIDDVYGYNFASSTGSPAHENSFYHGTHVAGLAAAKDNNSIGVTGVMGRNIQIMALNVFGSSASASSANIVNAINYARDKGADIINMSLGGYGTSSSVNTAMVNAVAAGVFIAIAAGNSNDLITSSNFYQPMGYAKDIAGAMSVGSVDARSLARSSFSNYSTTYVEIGAPGSDSATGGLLSTYTSNSYAYLQGTSMASPVLAGAAALVVGYVKSQGKTITPSQIESALKSAATSSGSLSTYFLGGYLLNLSSLPASVDCLL